MSSNIDLSKIKILKGNEIYRIYDLLGMSRDYDICQHLLKDPEYKDTIMYKYFSITENVTKNMPLLYNIICDYQKEHNVEIYDDSYVVMHLRTGDDFRNRGLQNKRNIDFYLEELKKYPDKKLIVVTAMHYGHKENSEYYRGSRNLYRDESYNKNIELLEEFFSHLPEDTEICSNDIIDIDFVKLVMCKNLIARPQAGGFAKVILELNNMHNEKLER